jgi:hypothetical protein
VSGAAAGHHVRSIAHSRPDACSVLWDDAQAQALGTAPLAKFWVALEQNGPWGAKAATQSHLDPDLGRALDGMCVAGGGRFILIRRPGRHSDGHDDNPRRVYIAGGLDSRPWLLEADLNDPAGLTRLAQLPSAALGGPDLDRAGIDRAGKHGFGIDRVGLNAVRDRLPEFRVSDSPVLMICANSRRDVCCSVRGRPVALDAASQRPGQVWECSHTGGHRFAPTGVLLPYGQTFGRLSGSSAVAAVDAARHAEVPTQLLGATCDRGRSHLNAPGQAAESIVRHRIQEPGLLALSTVVSPRTDEENAWHCEVSHLDGRHWDVATTRYPCADDRPESCGKAPVPTWAWEFVVDSSPSSTT